MPDYGKPFVGPRNVFPLEFARLLVAREMDHARLERTMCKRGYRITKQFIGMLAHGQRRVPPLQLKRFCEVLACDEMERVRLHRAAALDAGFEIGGL